MSDFNENLISEDSDNVDVIETYEYVDDEGNPLTPEEVERLQESGELLFVEEDESFDDSEGWDEGSDIESGLVLEESDGDSSEDFDSNESLYELEGETSSLSDSHSLDEVGSEEGLDDHNTGYRSEEFEEGFSDFTEGVEYDKNEDEDFNDDYSDEDEGYSEEGYSEEGYSEEGYSDEDEGYSNEDEGYSDEGDSFDEDGEGYSDEGYEDSDESDGELDDEELASNEDLNESTINNESALTAHRDNNSSLAHKMGIDKGNFSVSYEEINIDSIVIPKFKKSSRIDTAVGLSGVVKDMGALTPISVMYSAGYHKAIEEGTADSYMGQKYVLLDGFRRIYACVRNKDETIKALVYDFKDTEQANESAIVLGLIINKSKGFSWSEAYNMGIALEQRGIIIPKDIDNLLNLNSGEWMKLKDIALSTSYPEIWEDLIAKKKTLDQSYNALQKLRKEEDQASIEDDQGVEGMGEIEELAKHENNGQLNKEEVDSILELTNDDLSFAKDGDEVESMFGEATGELQDTKNRKPLDPILRGKILARDDYSCQCCGFGKGMQKTNIAAMQLAIHHVVSVYIGKDGGASTDDEGMIAEGSDVPRLLTVCEVCHHAIHNLVGTQGKLGMLEEDFANLEEHEQRRWRSVAKYAQILLAAEKKVGKHLKQSVPTKLPRTPFWESRDANMEAIAAINKPEILESINPLPHLVIPEEEDQEQGTAESDEDYTTEYGDSPVTLDEEPSVYEEEELSVLEEPLSDFPEQEDDYSDDYSTGSDDEDSIEGLNDYDEEGSSEGFEWVDDSFDVDEDDDDSNSSEFDSYDESNDDY